MRSKILEILIKIVFCKVYMTNGKETIKKTFMNKHKNKYYTNHSGNAVKMKQDVELHKEIFLLLTEKYGVIYYVHWTL